MSARGITKDLEALKEEGFTTTMLTLSDVTIPWGAQIEKDPHPKSSAGRNRGGSWWNMPQRSRKGRDDDGSI